MRYIVLSLLCIMPAGSVPAGTAAGADAPQVYVPYEDIASLLAPGERAVLMDRAAFAKLLAAAKANERAASGRAVGEVVEASYTARIDGETLALSGRLKVVSLGDGPVAVPVGFGQVGLGRVLLDGRDAPLGFDTKGRLTLVVQRRGEHALDVEATGRLKELAGGGMQFAVGFPTAAAGTLRFSAPGDLEVHANVPVASRKYDRAADRTDVVLAVGGHASATVVLLGNGRRDDERAILLGTSATTVHLTAAHQTMDCLYTVEVLRRGVRELTFALPAEWTVTDVSCPSLVKWSVAGGAKAGDPKRLTVRLRTARRGTKAVRIGATTARAPGGAWVGPFVRLVGADYQHGHLLVDTGGELAIRGQSLHNARRKDLALAALIPGLIPARSGRMFYHWSPDWSVRLELDEAVLRRSCEARHRYVVSPEQVVLTSTFDVTAVGREMYEAAFDLPAGEAWLLDAVRVNGQEKGFEYRLVRADGRRVLKLALATPLRVESVAKVTVSMHHVPDDWAWPAGAAARELALPLPAARAGSVSGLVAVAPGGDLDVAAVAAPAQLAPVNVGRMSLLGLAGDVRLAWTYDRPAAGAALRVRVSRRAHRLSAGSVGLVTVRPTKMTGLWHVNYAISRAHTRKLYLLADKSLGRELEITARGGQLASKAIVAPGPKTVELPEAAAAAADLWELTLDSPAIGTVRLAVRYDRPVKGRTLRIPLVRPAGADHATEMLALQASEELAVDVRATGAADIDAIDLPPLPAPARRLLRAFRLEARGAGEAVWPGVELTTRVHERYAVPPALAAEAAFTTHLGPGGRTQRTRAVFRVANAGLQFLTVRLPAGAELWSVRVQGRPAKPKQSAADTYRVAIGRSAEPREVEVVYALDSPVGVGPGGRLRLGRATLVGVKTNSLRWTVIPAPGERVARQVTDLDHPARRRVRLAGEEFLDGLKEAFGLAEALLAVGSGKMALKFIRTAEDTRTAPVVFGPAMPEVEAEPEEKADKDLGKEEEDETTLEAAKRESARRRDRGGESAEGRPAPSRKPKPAKPATPGATKRPAGRGERFDRAKAVGRYTLPVRLVGLAGAGPAETYAALGAAELEIVLADDAARTAHHLLGMAVVLLAGFVMIRCCPGRRGAFLLAVLAGSTLVAIWLPAAAYLANGAFYGALWLIPVYVAAAALRWLWPVVLWVLTRLAPRAAASAAVVAAVALAAGSAHAGGRGAPPAKPAPLVVPYDGDPTRAEQAGKVLVPYSRYVELWNAAHPDRKIELPPSPVKVSLAAVHYAAKVTAERVDLVLTARVRTVGRGAVVLPMPFSGLAVLSATLDGNDARLQAGPKGLILTLPGGLDGQLKLTAAAAPKTLGRRGSIRVGLPPLPAAVMTVDLPAADLELEAPGIEGTVSKAPAPAGGGARWIVPLGGRRDVTLRWSPKVGAGAADRTLSAAANHDVHAFHWALVGVSRIAFTFSAGANDRFGLLVPEGVTLTGLTGANVRDVRPVGRRTVGGVAMRLVEVRLHRPATKGYELTARWVGPLPPPGRDVRLPLPRAAAVGRESGTVTLHAAAGMTLKVVSVVGGRRSTLAGNPPATAKGAPRPDGTAVGRYYWPYRPFSLTLRLARRPAEASVRLDQLVRVDRRRTELLVQASLAAKAGRIFGASFALPGGYELLSVVGPAVEDHFEQKAPSGRRLHVNFRSGVAKTTVALVLVRKEAVPAALAVPAVRAIDADGQPLADQAGRLAVQVAASLDAQTDSASALRAVPPRELSGWLEAGQLRAVRFAYHFETPDFALRLKVRPQKTRTRVEVFAGVSVRPALAWYSYRLRYRIEGTPVDQVRFTLPSRYAPLAAVASPSLRGVRKRELPGAGGPGRTEWTVDLVTEVTGTLDVTVNFALPIEPTTSGLEIPRIEAPAPAGHEGVREGYRAIVAVQNVSRHKLGMPAPRNLAPLPPSEQRKLLDQAVRKDLQFVLQSFTEDWSAVLELTPARPAARVQAVVDLLALTTVIDRAGRSRCTARLMLQNRTRQFLRVRVPESLRLWSARVAGQAVKPVTDPAAGADVVLIPLVKTSPGGLPYEVELYLAGRAAEPLGAAGEISPPAVEVLDVKVERTTWSLLLPKGYRYLRPGGNLSRVLSQTEQKLEVLGVRLKQARRLFRSYEDLVAAGSGAAQVLATENFKVINRDISFQITNLREEIGRNADRLDQEDNERLQARLEQLTRTQKGMQAKWQQDVEQRRRQEQGGINPYLNMSASNGGQAEVARNDFLNALPGFIRAATEQQQKAISADLLGNEAVAAQANKYQQEIAAGREVLKGGKLALGKGQTWHFEGSLDIDGTRLLAAGEDEAERVEQLRRALAELDLRQRRSTALRRKELEDQLAVLGDNRLQRYYGRLSQAGQQAAGQPQAPPQGQTVVAGGVVQTDGRMRFGSASGTWRGLTPAGNAPASRSGGRSAVGDAKARPAGPGAAGGGWYENGGLFTEPAAGERPPGADSHALDPTARAAASGGQADWADASLAVAGGTFSLPVALPAGGTRLDFQGPTGRPVVRVLAVREDLLSGAHSSGAVVVIAVVFWLLGRLWRQLRRLGPPVGAAGFLAGYLLLAAVLAALVAGGGMSLPGAFVLFGAIVCPVELVHRLLSRRDARAPAAG